MYSSYSQRGRGRGYSSSTTRTPSNKSSTTTPSLTDRHFDEGLKPTPIKTISVPVLDSTDKPVKIKNVEYIGSYNWVKDSSSKPTILVPGMYLGYIYRTTLNYRIPTVQVLRPFGKTKLLHIKSPLTRVECSLIRMVIGWAPIVYYH